MGLVRKMRLQFPLTVAIIVQLCAQTALTFSTDNVQTEMLRHLGLSEPPHLEKRDLQNVRVPARVRARYGALLEGQRRRARRDVPSLVGILRELSGNVDITGDVLYSDPTRHRLLFEMKGRIADNSEVTLAELRLFKVAPLRSELRLHRRSRHNARVSILWVEALPNGRNRTSIVDSRLIPVEDSGWKSFDVTDAVHLWMRTRDGPMHLEVWIEAERPGRRATDVARLVRFTTQVHTKSSLEKPEIIIYSIDLAEYGAREDCNQAEPVGNDHRCCRRDNYINFRELSWTQYWVIEPAGYHAYECAGGCKRPPRGSHARGERACAVVESSPLPMMYLVKKGDYAEIEVAEFPNMVVQKCGCAQNSAAIV